MSYTIISTYPQSGSQNIGDKLITDATEGLLRDVKGVSDFLRLWRADDIRSNLHEINSSRGMVFACLAIRPNMLPKVYGFPDDLSQFRVPLTPLAAGTNFLPVDLERDPLASQTCYDRRTMRFLESLSRRVSLFSCRGELTYNFLRCNGIGNATMTGDVAFYEPRLDHLKFRVRRDVSHIGITTPHYPKLYSEHFYRFGEALRRVFPVSKITVVLHGKSDWLRKDRVARFGGSIASIYSEMGAQPLDIYSQFDIHAGYRVHGHVSALKRRIPSYLFAIDGRGAEYGLTLSLGTTLRAWKRGAGYRPTFARLRLAARSAVGPSPSFTDSFLPSFTADFGAISFMVDLIRRDAAEGFDRFLRFEREIARFNRRLKEFAAQIP